MGYLKCAWTNGGKPGHGCIVRWEGYYGSEVEIEVKNGEMCLEGVRIGK